MKSSVEGRRPDQKWRLLLALNVLFGVMKDAVAHWDYPDVILLRRTDFMPYDFFNGWKIASFAGNEKL
ncbi:MAG TPA: hypothetical protein VFL76_10910 [Edaphocola sp.]|nr:hypothetical protein [Edaphocola sp.]